MNNVWSDWIDGEPQESDVPVGEMLMVKTKHHGIHHIPMWGMLDMRPIEIESYQRQIKQRIQFKRVDPNAVLPRRAAPGDAGFDMSSVETFELLPGQRRLYKTGIQCAIPEGWAGIIKPRSGLALKKGIDVLAGVIDSSYRGEVCVLLQNHGDAIVSIRIGDRIAQLVVVPYMGEAVEVDELDDTARGVGGFGSSGR